MSVSLQLLVLPRPFLNDHQFRMGGGVLLGFPAIMGFRDHETITHQQGANRHFTDQRRRASQRQGPLHEAIVKIVERRHLSSRWFQDCPKAPAVSRRLGAWYHVRFVERQGGGCGLKGMQRR